MEISNIVPTVEVEGQEKTKFARFIPLHIPLPKQLKPSALKAARFLSTIVEEPPDSVADPLND